VPEHERKYLLEAASAVIEMHDQVIASNQIDQQLDYRALEALANVDRLYLSPWIGPAPG
jgi:hypothetical protein